MPDEEKKKSPELLQLLEKVDITRKICQHAIGEHHTQAHRMTVGTVIMVVGVCIAKYCGEMHFVVLHIGGDIVGYLIHAFGATPYLEWLIQRGNK